MRRNRHPNKYRESKNKECMITLALFRVNMLQFILSVNSMTVGEKRNNKTKTNISTPNDKFERKKKKKEERTKLGIIEKLLADVCHISYVHSVDRQRTRSIKTVAY